MPYFPPSGGGAPIDATYITQIPNSGLIAEQALNALADGILKHSSGVIAKAISDTDFAAAIHGARHKLGGADSIKLDEFDTPTDNTNLNATTGRHGLLVKLSGIGTNNYLAGDGSFKALPNIRNYFTLSGNVSTAANTTPVDVTGFVFNYAANAVYLIRIVGRFNAAAATTGNGLQFNVSTAVTFVQLQFFHQLANTGTLTGGSSIADDASEGVSSGIPTAGTDVPFFACGLLSTGSGGTGTAQLRLRSEVNAVTTIKAGAVMEIIRVDL